MPWPRGASQEDAEIAWHVPRPVMPEGRAFAPQGQADRFRRRDRSAGSETVRVRDGRGGGI